MNESELWTKISPLIWPLTIVLLSLITGIIIRITVINRLTKLAKKSKSKLDDIFLESLRSVIIPVFLLLGIYLAMELVQGEKAYKDILQKVSQAILIFSIFWFLVQLLGKVFIAYFGKRKSRIPAASIIQNTVKVFTISIGVLIILQTMGISITPILTTLGVGGLAVALALQDTLANLFAGFQIIASGRVRQGDYIKLDSGDEGYVVDIKWRDTVLRQLDFNHIIIPNSTLSSAVVVNYYRPEKSTNLLVEVGVDYGSDLEMVERVTLEVARETLKAVPGGTDQFEAFMRYHTFADSSINFTIRLRCKEFYDRFLLQHEFIKRLKKRYDQEGINIPFPIRTVIMQKEENTEDSKEKKKNLATDEHGQTRIKDGKEKKEMSGDDNIRRNNG